MRAGNGSVLDDPGRPAAQNEGVLAPPEAAAEAAYLPRLRRDQIRGLYNLKQFEGRPMTKLAQEESDRLLEEYGGAEALLPAASPDSATKATRFERRAPRSEPQVSTGRRSREAAPPRRLFCG